MKQYKALVRYLDRKANCMRQVWLDVQAPNLKEAWAEVKSTYTTLDVVEA